MNCVEYIIEDLKNKLQQEKDECFKIKMKYESENAKLNDIISKNSNEINEYLKTIFALKKDNLNLINLNEQNKKVIAQYQNEINSLMLQNENLQNINSELQKSNKDNKNRINIDKGVSNNINLILDLKDEECAYPTEKDSEDETPEEDKKDSEEFEKEVAAADNISEKERIELINNGKFLPSYMWNVNGWLCSKLGLTEIEQTQKCVPQTYKEDIESSTLGMTVKAGQATGMSAVVTTQTKEGIILETECIGKVYSKEDYDKNEWTIYGEPNTTIVVARPSTVELTCATVVNRIPDVINAEPGYVTTEKMGELNYRVKPLNEYVK